MTVSENSRSGSSGTQTRAASLHSPTRTSARRITLFAWLGAAVFAFDVAILISWVTGPNWRRVEPGPDVPPQWMQAGMVIGQVALSVLMVFCFYWYLVRPWRRERRITFDGLAACALLMVSMWDMLSGYGQNWFSYNTYLLNFGSPLSEVPGVTSLQAPGAGQALPLLIVPAVYVAGMGPMMIFGCWTLRRVKARFPGIGPGGILGTCLVFAAVIDAIGEGLVFLPLGWWSYGGGHALLFQDQYFKYPWHECFHGAMFLSVMILLRYYTNDRGQCYVEHGVERMSGGEIRKAFVRFLAILAALQIGTLIVYQVPQTLWGLNSTAWPADVQNRSYLTDNICGPLVDRACPGPATPIHRPGAPYLDYSGRLVTPEPR